MSDSGPAEDFDYDSLSASELLEEGKSLFRDRKYPESAEFFSRALEKKSGDDPVHPSLREYYLWYADALLTNEEQNSNIFSSNVDQGSDNTLPSAQSVVEAANKEQNDEMLAFDLFQFGYESYLNYFNKLDKKVEEEEVLDASYCLEYEKAIKLREEYNLGEKHTVSLYISLAQSQMFNGELNKSVESFERSKKMLEKLVESDGSEKLKNTLEDVSIQLEDLKKLIAESKGENGHFLKGSQSNAASLVPKTTSSLDQRQLDHTAVKTRVIDVNSGAEAGKKRRIDLTKVYD